MVLLRHAFEDPQLAALARRDSVAPMLHADVVPDHDISHFPLMRILGRVVFGMPSQLRDKRVAVRRIRPRDTGSEIADVKGAAPAVRMRGEDRIRYRPVV
jgi:hypothetical protein